MNNIIVHEGRNADFVPTIVILVGVGILGLFFWLFGIWAFFAPIDSAAIATGQLVVDFNRKIVQHFEGGIIDQILVKEGQFVLSGEPLLILSDISAKSQRQILLHQLLNATAVKYRLISERDGNLSLDFSHLSDMFGHFLDLDQILGTQFSLFVSRRRAFSNKQQILLGEWHR